MNLSTLTEFLTGTARRVHLIGVAGSGGRSRGGAAAGSSSSEMIRRMEARISSIVGSC